MASDYCHRLERVEAAIAPRNQLVVLVLKDGDSQEDALAAYARAHGLTAAEVGGHVVCLSEADWLL
jgi:hypothetical protein